jgi:hypothetical protein
MNSSIEKESLVNAIEITCAECGHVFSICSSCWRGQKYCTKHCLRSSRLKQRRIAQSKYQKTAKGLEFGRLRQSRRYEKNKIKKFSLIDLQE